MFDGKNPDEYFEWIAKVELVAQWAADPEEWSEYQVALLRSKGSVYTQLQNTHAQTPWHVIKAKLQAEFSSLPTLPAAIAHLKGRKQYASETLDKYTQEYYRLVMAVHQRTPQECDLQTVIYDYIAGIRDKHIASKCVGEQSMFRCLLDAGNFAARKAAKYKMIESTLPGTSTLPIMEVSQEKRGYRKVPSNPPPPFTQWHSPNPNSQGRIMPKSDRINPEVVNDATLEWLAHMYADRKCFHCQEFGHPIALCEDEESLRKLAKIRRDLKIPVGERTIDLKQTFQVQYPTEAEQK